MANFKAADAAFVKVQRGTGIPYISVFVQDIVANKKIQLFQSHSITIKKTSEVKKLIAAVEEFDGDEVDKILFERGPRGAKSARKIFEDITKSDQKYGWTNLDKAPYSGSGGGRSKADPHELMTAALVLNKKEFSNQDVSTIVKSKEIIDTIYELSRKVTGFSEKDRTNFYMDATKTIPDMENLAKALSASNHILRELGSHKNNINAVWQTGASWAKEIKKFDVGPKTVQNYNSSDIVVKFKSDADHYWGVSLKKIEIGKPEPTLLNKPPFGNKGMLLITKNISASDNNKVEKTKRDFFQKALEIELPEKVEELKKMQNRAIYKKFDTTFNKDAKNAVMTSKGKFSKCPNIYFEMMDKIILKALHNNKEFFEVFLDTIFKINLDTYMKDTAFHFSLITGAGKVSGEQIEIGSAIEKEGRLVSEIFRSILGDADRSKYILKKTKGKTQAFEPNSSAAKLYYTMSISNREVNTPRDIVELEVRFKGTVTAQPQFQVFLSKTLDSFNSLYKSELSKNKLKRRW